MHLRTLPWTALAGAAAACAPPPAEVPDPFAASGELIAMSGAAAGATNACFTCHGLDGGGNGAGVPRLAGLHSGYLQHQMEAFADGRRHNPEMRWIAQQLSGRERRLVSDHYAGLEWRQKAAAKAPRPPALFLAGDPARGLPPCASCHGVDGLGAGPGIPPLAGQPGEYIAQQLHSWRRGQRRSDPAGVMQEIARSLTPAEIRDLASFVSQLPGGAARPGSREASPSARRSDPRNDASELPRRVAGS